MTTVLEEDEEKQSRNMNDQGVLAAIRPVHQKKKKMWINTKCMCLETVRLD
jgi:hypothetical protein